MFTIRTACIAIIVTVTLGCAPSPRRIDSPAAGQTIEPHARRELSIDRCPPDRVTNAQLVAAMPDGVASILVWRHKPLPPETLARPLDTWEYALQKGRCDPQRWLQYVVNIGNDDHEDIASITHNAMSYCDVAVYALGGSLFEHAHLALGNFCEREIFVTRRPMLELRSRLASGDIGGRAVRPRDIDGLRVYDSDVNVRREGYDLAQIKTKHLVFLSDHVVVMTDWLEDLQAMVATLRGMDAGRGGRWSALAAHVDFESPMLLLRDVTDDGQERDWLWDAESTVQSYALTMSPADLRTSPVHVVAQAVNPEQARLNPDFGWSLEAGGITTGDDWFSFRMRLPAEAAADLHPAMDRFVILMLFGCHIHI